ncbi:hypothetical protein MN116_001957 [Schistosoma mekongi]|uniref:Metalloprotease TIKI homolog n=1 Tax=Schistosoma mekongi TaxID=38744 RepID=A0AAE1ZJ13_SCHME|nr:hypothetical protein MN116_001957 [Schistosoma mekongi]
MYYINLFLEKCIHLILLLLLLFSLPQLVMSSLVFPYSTTCFISDQLVNIPQTVKNQLTKSFSTSLKPRITFYQPLIVSVTSKMDCNRQFKRQTRSISIRSLTKSNKCSHKTSKRKNTFLWKISTKPTSFLFGTLHVAYTHVWSQIDPVVKTSFAQSDIVYFELDLTNPVTLTELSDCQVLPKNQTITNLLRPDLIQRLSRYLNNFRHVISKWVEPEKKIYASYLYETLTKDWKEKRPIWLLLLLNSLTRSEISDRGVPILDLFLAQEAQRLGKKRGAVEQVNDQCEPLNRINVNQVTFALEITLNNLENANHPTKYLTNTFNNVNNSDHANYSSSNNNKYSSNTKLLLNTWNKQMNQTSIKNKQHKPIVHENLFNSPTDQLIEYYNCGDLNATLSKIYPTQTTPSESVVSTALFATNSNVIMNDNNSTKQHEYSNKVNKNSKRHNYHTQSASIKSSYFIDKEITQFLSSSQIQTLIDLENYLNEELIIKRNERMAREISSKLKLAESLNQSAFFALGAAHFLGSGETIIDHLRNAGYIIIPVPRQNTVKNEDIINEIAGKPSQFDKSNIISK